MDNTERIYAAIAYLKSGNKAEAKALLIKVVKEEPKNARVWYLLSQAVDNKEQAIYCIEKVLEIDPLNEQAIRRLNTLKGVVPTPEPPPASAPQPVVVEVKEKKRNPIITLLAAISLVVLACICVSVIYTIGTQDTEDEQPVVEAPVEEPATIATEVSTAVEPTLQPTTLAPTPAQERVLAPSCAEIIAQTNGMTDIQWQNFKENIKGKWIVEWSGTITQVSDESLFDSGYTIHVKVDRCSVLFDIQDESQAMALRIDQPVVMTAEIDMLADVFGKVIYLNEDSLKWRVQSDTLDVLAPTNTPIATTWIGVINCPECGDLQLTLWEFIDDMGAGGGMVSHGDVCTVIDQGVTGGVEKYKVTCEGGTGWIRSEGVVPYEGQ